MFSRIGSRKKIILSMLFMVLLIWGVQGVSSVEAAPDLVVGTPRVSPYRVAAGGIFTLSVPVTNRGNTPADATTVKYYRSTNQTIDTTADQLVDADSVPTLGVGASLSPELSASLKAPPSPGTYYYGAYIIPVNGEAVTDNNTSAGVALTVGEGTPNLTLNPYLSADASNVAPGQFVTLIAYVSNSSNVPSLSTTFSAHLSYDGISDVSTIPPVSVTRDISPGVTRYPVYIGVVIPSTSRTYSRYYYRVQMGTATTRYTLLIVNPVDLSVSPPSVDRSSVAPGETFTLSSTVSNVATGSFTGSHNITLRYFRSADTTLNATDGTDTQVGTDLTSSISGTSGATSANITLTATAPSEPGTYYYYAYVVPLPGEGYYYYTTDRTANNTSSYVAVTVSAPPDLTVSLYRPRQATFAPGERFTLDATVYNSGTGASAATQLRVYEDSDDYRREQQITSRAVSAISAGSSTSVSIPLTAPTDGGVYYYRVSVDMVTRETETGNNTSNWIGIDVLEPLVLESLQPPRRP